MKSVLGTSANVLDLVIPNANDRRRSHLLPLMDAAVGRPASPTREDIESLPQPADSHSGVRFNYTYDELVAITSRLTPGGPKDLHRVIRYALIWSGMKIADEVLHWSTLDHGYKPRTRLPRVTLPIYDKRLSIRVVPNAWGGLYGTPFKLQLAEGEPAEIVAVDGHGEKVEIASPTQRFVTESMQTLAYPVGQPDGSKNFSINPLQSCPQSCAFCCRGYREMTAERRRELVNLKPDEMARALVAKFPTVEDWGDISGISLVTGDFRSEEDILDYIEEFVASMRQVTSGQWDPITTGHQNIGVSTHLLKSLAGMERAKALGVRRFIHTVEMVDDNNREEVMCLGQRAFQPSPLNKGHMPFSDILDVLIMAMDVFGASNVEPVLIIGLDPLDRAKQAMDRLKEIGISRVSRALINAYDINQLSLMSLPFEDAVAGMQYARDLFDSAHQKVVSVFNNPAEIC